MFVRAKASSAKVNQQKVHFDRELTEEFPR